MKTLREEIEKIIGENLKVYENDKKVKVKYLGAVDKLVALVERETLREFGRGYSSGSASSDEVKLVK